MDIITRVVGETMCLLNWVSWISWISWIHRISWIHLINWIHQPTHLLWWLPTYLAPYLSACYDTDISLIRHVWYYISGTLLILCLILCPNLIAADRPPPSSSIYWYSPSLSMLLYSSSQSNCYILRLYSFYYLTAIPSSPSLLCTCWLAFHHFTINLLSTIYYLLSTYYLLIIYLLSTIYLPPSSYLLTTFLLSSYYLPTIFLLSAYYLLTIYYLPIYYLPTYYLPI